MSLYGQEPEVALLARFVPRLGERSFVDVGAERAAFTAALLRAGCSVVHAIEPEPDNAAHLRSRFRDESMVVIHECAAGEGDGELELHRSVARNGVPISSGHTVLVRRSTDQIAWKDSFVVPARSLASLVDRGEVPERVGILKVDTEGHDLAVVRGLGALDCAVVMVEHWTELPMSLGLCPWSASEITDTLRARGFSNFAFIRHVADVPVLQWNDAEVAVGQMGNLVFIHDSVADRLVPDILAASSSLSRAAGEIAEARRLAVNVQAKAASDRLAKLVEVTRRDAETVAVLRQRLELQTQAAADRLRVIEELDRAMRHGASWADVEVSSVSQPAETIDELKRRHEEALDALTRERDLQAEVAKDRLELIDVLSRERDVQAAAANERLDALEELRRERDRLAEVARERLAALEDLTRDYEQTVERLTQERDTLASSAEDRLTAIETLRRDSELHTPRRPEGWS